MERRINETLSELLIGILTAGVLIQIIQLLSTLVIPQFAGAGVPFATGLWIGIITALGLAVHMYRSINMALDMIAKDAEGYMRRAYLIRTVAILGVAGIVTIIEIGYVMAFFLGVLCLKFGALLQPLIHMLRKRFRK